MKGKSMKNDDLDMLLSLAADQNLQPRDMRMEAVFADADQIIKARKTVHVARPEKSGLSLRRLFPAATASMACAICGLFIGYSATASDFFSAADSYVSQGSLQAFGGTSIDEEWGSE